MAFLGTCSECGAQDARPHDHDGQTCGLCGSELRFSGGADGGARGVVEPGGSEVVQFDIGGLVEFAAVAGQRIEALERRLDELTAAVAKDHETFAEKLAKLVKRGRKK